MKILCLIPAKKYSKRLKNKNFLKFHGKKLFEWTIILSKKIKQFDKIIISTDSKDILKYNKKYPNVFFLKRPNKISGSKTSMSKVIKHAIDYLKNKNEYFDAVAVLQPTSPLRSVKTVKKALQRFSLNKPNFLASVSLLGHTQVPNMVFTLNNSSFVKNIKINVTNKNKKYYYLDGGVIFIFKLPNKKYKFEGKGAFINVKFPENIDINIKEDFLLAKKFFKKNEIY